MPIGTGKVGLFGGVAIAIEAGSETFNAPGTFTVPADLKVVSLSGNGSTGNAGNPGNPGGDGIGGGGGSGGYIPNFYVPSSSGAISCGSGIFGVQRSGGGSGSGPDSSGLPICPYLNPPGGPGNPGNPGGVTSVFGYSWTAGAAGNGGTGGVDGSYGVTGASGTTYGTNCSPSPNSAFAVVAYNGGSGGCGFTSGGNGGGAAYNALTSNTPNCETIYFVQGSGLGGHGGGGAGTQNPGPNAPCNNTSYCNPGGITYGRFGPCPSHVNYCNGAVITCVPGGFEGGGRGGRGGASGPAPGQGNPCDMRGTESGQNAQIARAGAGGGGGGAGSYRECGAANNSPYVGAGVAGTGGGGGGSGSAGNPGSGAGNPGSSGIPATFNCVSVSEGCYPVQVGASGQVIISWNAQ